MCHIRRKFRLVRTRGAIHSHRRSFVYSCVGSLDLDPPSEEWCRSFAPDKRVTEQITNGEKNNNDQSSRETTSYPMGTQVPEENPCFLEDGSKRDKDLDA